METNIFPLKGTFESMIFQTSQGYVSSFPGTPMFLENISFVAFLRVSSNALVPSWKDECTSGYLGASDHLMGVKRACRIYNMKYVYIPRKLSHLCFGGLTFHFMGHIFQNTGHLGSRYVYIYTYLSICLIDMVH